MGIEKACGFGAGDERIGGAGEDVIAIDGGEGRAEPVGERDGEAHFGAVEDVFGDEGFEEFLKDVFALEAADFP